MSESEQERRPRPIGAADESDEDSDVERNDTTPAPPPNATGEAAPEEATAKKPSKKMPAFSENDLVKDKGLRQIYRDFPQKCQYKGKGREAEFLRGLMIAYKEWSYQLYPGVAFEDLASRTEKLGGKARTRDLMRELRETERDRVIEAKYGRAAVDNMRAQEAAKLAADESKAAGAQEEKGEEREEEEDLAGSRYAMEVDGEGGKRGDDGRSNSRTAAEKASSSASVPASVMSEQVRQRIEVNRRLALERLRLKKEEAAAASRKEDVVGAAALPAVDDNSSNELMDLMDVDGGGSQAAGESVDDQAALADMETEEMTKRPSTATPPRRAAVEPSPAVSFTSPALPSAVGGETSPAPTQTVAEELALPEPSTRQEEVMEYAGSSAFSTATAVANDIAPACGSGVVVDEAVEGAVVEAAARAGHTAGVDGASNCAGATAGRGDGDEPGTTAEEEDSSELPPASGAGEPLPGVAEGGETVGANDEGASLRAGVVSSEAPEASVGGAAVHDPAAIGCDVAAGAVGSFSSPAKCKRAPACSLPLSPLGNLFASTDVAAEGGLAAVGAKVGGLFSDEKV